MKRAIGYLVPMIPAARPPIRSIFNLTVFVAALGYFVDMFDLLLFPIVRQSGLTALGIPPGEAQITVGAFLLNALMVGMLLGGIFWGVLGDRAMVSNFRLSINTKLRSKK